MQKLEKLNLLDDFMFFSTVNNIEVGEEFARTLLEIIFARKFGRLKIVPQKVYYGTNVDLHGVRLDVYLDEEISSKELIEEAIAADIEVESSQKERYKSQIPKRVRFYHAKIDSESLKAGEDYLNLRKVIVVMIMPFDPFGYDQIIYTIQNKCLEVPELPYDDGAKTMFLYTRGKKGTVSRSLKELLRYMEESTEENATNKELKRIHSMVTKVKQDAEVTVGYMKWAETQRRWTEEGREEGRAMEIVRLCREFGQSEEAIKERLMKDLNVSIEAALAYMETSQ